IEQFRAAFGNHDVARFEVAMNHSFAMRLAQRFGNLHAVLENLRERQRTFDQSIGERLSLEQLHHDVVVADVIKRADVRMRQMRNRLCLTLEADLELCVLCEFGGQNLDRDVAVQPRITCPVDLSHAARSDWSDDFGGPRESAGGGGHAIGENIPAAKLPASPESALPCD